MRILFTRWLLRIFALGMMISVFSHCSKDFTTTPQTKQKQDQIIVVSDLNASSSHIVIGGAQIVVQAKLTNQNNEVVNGQPVHFSTTLGSITPVDTTDGQGLAHAVLISGLTPGAAIIKAQYKDEHSRTITVYFDSSGTSSFSFQAAPNSILANGVDSVSVVVKVLDNAGKPAKNSPVFFSSTAGQFTSSIVYSDSMGAARNLFHSYPSRFDSTAILTFRVNGMESQTSVTLRGVEFHLSANPTYLIANDANQSEIRGILKETTSKIAIPDEVVTFSTTLGTIPWKGVTGDDGLVKVTLTSSMELGSARIIGTYGGGIRDTVYVDFIKSEPANLYVTVDKQVLPADNASTAEIQVRITDVNNDPTADGLPVHFTIVKGSGSIDRVKTIVNGMVKNYLTAGNHPDTTIVRITAGSLQDSVQVIYTVGEPAFLELTADSTSLPADGITATQVRAKVLDQAGNFVRDGTTVQFAASIGNITTEATTYNGIAVAQFSSNKTGIAVIQAQVGSLRDEITVNLRPGKAASVLLTYDPTSMGVRDSGRNQTVRIVADVRDSKNNVVSDGTQVRFSIYASPQGGESLSSYDPVPTVNGKSEVSLLSGVRSGTVRIQAEVVDGQNQPLIPPVRAISTEIIIYSGPPFIENVNDRATSHLTVGTSPVNIFGWHVVNNTATVVAVVGDKYNNPVPVGTAVYFTTTGGVVSTHTGYTNEEGIATVTIHSAQPYPDIDRFYNTFFDPNADHSDFSLGTHVIPGPIPDFESGQVINSRGTLDENDGIARILATSEGVDANGKKATVWAVAGVVFSGGINTFTVDVSKTTLSPGESAYITIQIYDENGNPIVGGSSLTAEAAAGALSWTDLETSDPGVTLYNLSLTNNLDPNNPNSKETATPVTIRVTSDNGNAIQSTPSILLKLE